MYLNFNSNHPKPCKTGLVNGQALRIVERCTDKQDANNHLKNLENKLLERNYPERLVKANIVRAQGKDRRTLIYKKKPQNQQDRKVRLILPLTKATLQYTSGSDSLKSTWKEMRRLKN